ncbi:AmmeMemoRadiSam system protein B [Propionibacterium freudenreichii]|uniref:AmmeMemoRadiSam system protein B n=1 Tax=Propionibacterium freudenreichii TaxID=1744 RepID=UPI000542BACA|nr:AmmeMemoRadiSam system protein B [Propionibacterium freudenreichii]CEG95634.1 Hypothetical protein PFCIRM123_09475 [Propionibacterium freudenreichii]
MVTRPTAVAGSFYPGQRGRLARELDTLFEQADRPPAQVSPARVKAIVVPHAGYVYSGTTAATGYELLRGRPINRVVVLGPTHRVGIRGMALAGADAFDTPLGPVPVDPDLTAIAEAVPLVVTRPDVHAREHSLEVQLPFIRTVLPQASVLPVAVGDALPDEVAALLDAVWGESDTAIVISSDLSHYHSYDDARKLDAGTIDKVLALDDTVAPNRACGCFSLNGLLLASGEHHLTPTLLSARNSGDTAGDKGRVVGYASFAFQADQ